MRLEHDRQEHRGHAFANGSSHDGSSLHTNGSARSGEANGFHSNGSTTTLVNNSPFFGHDREQVTRILLQSLSDLGYSGAAGQLSRESGFQLEIPTVAAFRNAVQIGGWDEAEQLLFGSDAVEQDGGVPLGNGHAKSSPRHRSKASFGSTNGHTPVGLPLADGADITTLKFLLRQQKYLELLERGDRPAALTVLRNELTPLKKDTGRVHALTGLIMCSSSEDLRNLASWDGAEGESRNDLLTELSKSISPSVMIPEHRLATLLTSVQQQQIIDCQYHNTTAPPSLYTEHECAADDFPLHTLTELSDHMDEVWYLAFSHDGSLLATAGKDGLVTVYDTNRWKVLHEFREHERNAAGPDTRGVCYVAFSPDDKYLITCSQNNEFLVMDVQEGRVAAKGDHFDYPVTAAAWLPDSETFVIGAQSARRPLGLYSMRQNHNSLTNIIHNNEIHSWRDPPWEGGREYNGNTLRITDVAVSHDGTRMAASTIDNRIITYDLQTKQKISDWPMEDKLTSINFSEDGAQLLVNMNDGRVWALDSVTGEDVVHYEGARQAEFVIRSSFGGAGENFVISGSEDSCVYIWRRETGVRIAALEGHTRGTVNAVAWHPTNPSVFASAGDDRKVRIWSSANVLHTLAAEAGTSGSSGPLYPYQR